MGRRKQGIDRLRRKWRAENKRRQRLLRRQEPVAANSDHDKATLMFVKWCLEEGMTFSSKVCITAKNVVHGRGMVATASIAEDELLFEIPRSVLFSEKTCTNSELLTAATLTADEDDEEDAEEADEEEVKEGGVRADADTGVSDNSKCTVTTADDDAKEGTKHRDEGMKASGGDEGDLELTGWSPLLLAMMLEMDKGASSRFARYFDILPAPNTLRHPHLWSAEERSELLADSRLEHDVERDLSLMHQEYAQVVRPFMEAHDDVFDNPNRKAFSFTTYARCAAIVMGYSFTDDEDGRACLVPVADILNHVTGKNNARLFFSGQSFQMRSIKAIAEGEEIFNTYGDLDNLQLIQQHGFSEPEPTPFEEAAIPLESIRSILDLSDAVFAQLQELVEELTGDDGALLVDMLDSPLSYPNWLFVSLVQFCISSQVERAELRDHIQTVHAAQDEEDDDEEEAEERDEVQEEEEEVHGTGDVEEQQQQQHTKETEQVQGRADDRAGSSTCEGERKRGAVARGQGDETETKEQQQRQKRVVKKEKGSGDGEQPAKKARKSGNLVKPSLAEMLLHSEYGALALTPELSGVLRRIAESQAQVCDERAREVEASGALKRRRALAKAVFVSLRAVFQSWLDTLPSIEQQA